MYDIIVFYEKDYNLIKLKRILSYFGMGSNLALNIGKEEIDFVTKRKCQKNIFENEVNKALFMYEQIVKFGSKILLCHIDRKDELPSLEGTVYRLTSEEDKILFGKEKKSDDPIERARKYLGL